MRRNKPLIISLVILIIALAIMFINSQFYSFSDWIVRADGVIILLCIPLVTYNNTKKINS